MLVGARYDAYRIPVESMEPTLHVGDRVLARSIDGDDVARGDIVVFTAPGPSARPGIERISRVVALEGDEVSVEAGHLVVNGEPAEEPYLRVGARTNGLTPVTVRRGSVLVLSDNRENSQDSRVFGPVPRDNIYARVALRWWPLSRLGRL